MKTTATGIKTLKRIDPTELLRRVLAERCEKNPQYSIRAFARSTGISHTVLSLVLSGKRKLSKKAIQKLADYLELDPKQKDALLKTKKSLTADDFQTLELDTFELISDWYYYAILSLLSLPDASFDARWISAQLGIKTLTAKLAMDRMQRLNLIEQDADGKWQQTGKPIIIDNTKSTVATRKFHKQLLQRAAVSIEEDPIPVRDFSSMTFTLDPSQVEYARKRIRDFRRELVAELEFKENPSAVYHLTIQLYPVTPVNKKKEFSS